MRLKYIIFFLAICIIGYSFMRINLNSPEELIIGEWSESTWKYERAGSIQQKKNGCTDSLSTSVKGLLGKGLMIHENETWSFFPNGELHVLSPNHEPQVFYWRLKGKGDMLVIKDKNKNPLEHYKITQINKESLSLSFELDIQVKGLASMTFKKCKH